MELPILEETPLETVASEMKEAPTSEFFLSNKEKDEHIAPVMNAFFFDNDDDDDEKVEATTTMVVVMKEEVLPLIAAVALDTVEVPLPLLTMTSSPAKVAEMKEESDILEWKIQRAKVLLKLMKPRRL